MNIVIGAACFVVSASLGLQTWNLVLNLWDPFYYNSIVVMTPQVNRGGLFVEKLDIQRYRICKVEIDRFLFNDVTGDVLFRERVPGGVTRVGRTPDVRNSVKIPLDAPLGPTTLYQFVHSHCIDGMHSMQAPLLHFEIIE